MKSKKKVLGVYIGNFATYTRNSEVTNEKKSLRAIAFLKVDLKNGLGNADLDQGYACDITIKILS